MPTKILYKTQLAYLAGPFFNAPQRDAALKIANMCGHYDQHYFAPVMQPGGGKNPKPEDIERIFRANCGNLNKAAVVLVQLEWLLPPNREVRVVQPSAFWRIPEALKQVEMERLMETGFVPYGPHLALDSLSPEVIEDHRLLCSPPLNVPDSGTVWEMGYATCLREVRGAEVARRAANGQESIQEHVNAPDLRPVIVAYTTAPQQSLNLMLARSAQAYLQGWPAVEEFLATGVLQDADLQFKGRQL